MICHASLHGTSILRWWLTAASIGAFWLGGMAIGLIGGSVFPFAVLAAPPTAIWLTVYPPRYIERITVQIDTDNVYVQTGVWWRKHTAIPLTALRTVDLIQSPLQRRYGCVHMVLRFAGGMTVLPFLSHNDAHRIGDWLA